MAYHRLCTLLLLIPCFPTHSCAQANDGAQKKPAPAVVSVTLLMDWSRGDAHYGPDFIELRQPCQLPAEKSCECVADFKVISSKANSAEFANYVASFEHAKVRVTYEVTYSAEGLFLGARLLRVGNWTRDKFHPNDGLLGVKIRFMRQALGKSSARKSTAPGNVFLQTSVDASEPVAAKPNMHLPRLGP